MRRGFVGLALQDGELVAQRQDFDVFVRVAHGQQAYASAFQDLGCVDTR
jgi:hypothetical protein